MIRTFDHEEVLELGQMGGYSCYQWVNRLAASHSDNCGFNDHRRTQGLIKGPEMRIRRRRQ